MVDYISALRVRVPEELRAWVNARLLSAHLRSVRVMAAGLLFNVAVMTFALWDVVHPAPLALFACLLTFSAVRKVIHSTRETRQARVTDPSRLTRAMTINGAQIGLLMGAMAAWAIPHLAGMPQVIIILSIALQIGVAAYTTRTLPLAAYLHIGFLAIGLIVGIAQISGLMSIAAIALIIGATAVHANMVQVAHKNFVDRIVNEREVHNSAKTVKMLLNDFEAHSADWLFELDADHRIMAASTRFAQAAGRPAEALNGTDFSSLFEDCDDRTALQAALSSASPLRSIALKLSQGNGGSDTRWWNVSGSPLAAGLTNTIRFRGVISDISGEKLAEARVQRTANFDSLSELPNRHYFNSMLTRYFNGEVPYTRLALIVLDCDHFKAVNDMYGHPVGDKFLRAIAKRMEAVVESSGLGGEGHVVARLGGDEFAILISGDDVTDHSIRLAELLVEAFAEPISIDEHEIAAGASLGIALAPDHAISSDALLSYADIALYVAKEEGRSRWEMFQSGMDEALQRKHALARDLRSAVANGELRLFLQPLVNVETRAQAGFEALMRWEHPSRGMVMPIEFIPIAEETGLIVPIGEWMIRTALKEAAQWREPQAIAINLSPIQIASPNLITTIMSALAESGIEPGRVEFEITESVLLNDSDANIALLNQIHALGVKVALDDFGTGYASLNYLLTFPFDKIKIDRSFVSDLENREESRAIVDAVIRLANRLGMCTLAEGVEQESQLTKLREQGCEMVQGWLFGKAMPAAHYTAALTDQTKQADAA